VYTIEYYDRQRGCQVDFKLRLAWIEVASQGSLLPRNCLREGVTKRQRERGCNKKESKKNI
jgi:hypothetical protein